MHAIEEFTDGTAAFFSNREVPWHRLGLVTEGALTANEALKAAQLDWQVHKTDDPIAAPVLTPEGLELIAYDDKFLTYRTNPKTGKLEGLGVVGKQYTPIQNSEAFAFLNNLVDEHGAVFETAGSLHHGRKVFMSMKMPTSMTIGGRDQIDLYLVAWNSHDGLSAFNVVATPIRVVCQNTLTAAISRAKSSWSIRHTASATSQVQAARDTMGLTFAYSQAFEAEAEALIAQGMKDKEFAKFVESLVPMPTPKPGDTEVTQRVRNNVDQTRNEIVGLWKAPTQDNITGTKWAAWNAVTEWADWVKPVKGADDQGEARAKRIVTDLSDPTRASQPLGIKRKAWKMLATV